LSPSAEFLLPLLGDCKIFKGTIKEWQPDVWNFVSILMRVRGVMNISRKKQLQIRRQQLWKSCCLEFGRFLATAERSDRIAQALQPWVK
jgi:hypothetical protein